MARLLWNHVSKMEHIIVILLEKPSGCERLLQSIKTRPKKTVFSCNIHVLAVKIVHCCGFDSIPFDMGSFMAASYLWQKFGEKCQSAKVLNGRTSGGVSGGTIYSAILAAQAERKKRTGPHSLDATPGTVSLRRKEEVDFPLAKYDNDRKKYLVPSIMATVNTKIVRRSKSLFGNINPSTNFHRNRIRFTRHQSL
jgi:hypothetical protein